MLSSCDAQVAKDVVVSGSYDGGICAWSLTDGRKLATMPGHLLRITSLCMLSDCGKV